MNGKKGKKCPDTSIWKMENLTTLHGTSQFSLFKGNKLIIWKGLLILNLILTISFLLVIKNRYNNDQIITRIGTNCQLNQVPFPAVSICNFNMVSRKESASIIQILEKYNVTKELISYFLQKLPILKDYSETVTNITDLTEIFSIIKKHYFTVETLMEEVHQKCDKLLIYCEFNRKAKNCNDIFKVIKTYEGHCCTFNYAALNDDSETFGYERDNDFEYYDDPSADEVKTSSRILVTSESGRLIFLLYQKKCIKKHELFSNSSGSGLRVVFNVEPNDYPNWSLLPYHGAKILLNDPNDYPETTILYKLATIGESLDVKVEPLVFQCENDIRLVSPEKRACWFHDEVSLEHTDRYSFETCKTECKMQTYFRNCGCVPYKYPIEKSTQICEFEHLECLNNVTAYKSEEDSACEPICYMECRDKRYSITSDLTPFIPELFPSKVTKHHNISELTALQVYFAKSSCNSYKLMLLMDFNYFIATYGGIFSLSFGASILTICELVYLIVSFFIKVIRKSVVGN